MVRFFTLATALLCCHLAIAQNVFDPLDRVYTYDSATAAGTVTNPLEPPPNVMAKWIRSPRVAWNTGNFKAYIWNGMAFRLRFPNNYNPANAARYPVVVFFHGGGEIGPIHDNEFHLLQGAQLFEERMNQNEWNGFILCPQETSVGWDDFYFSRVNSVLDTLQKYNRADPDRVIAMGLSAGGYGAVAYANAYPLRVAASLAASPAQIRSLSDRIVNFKHIPVLLTNGGRDNNPDPFNAQAFYNEMRKNGANIYQSFYANKGHDTWVEMWNQRNATGGYIMSSYWNNSHKAQPLLYFQQHLFCSNSPIVARMGISAGFAAYEWDMNGTSIAGANGNEYTATQPGQYRVRFKREATGAWSVWTPNPVVIATKPCNTDTAFSEHFTADNFFVSSAGYNIGNFSCLGGIMTSGTDMITQDATGVQGSRYLVNYTYAAGGGCSFAPNDQVWKTFTPVAVKPNTNYIYTFYVANQNGTNPAKLAPVINGTVLIADSVQAISAGNASWTKFNFPWSSGDASTADLGIINRSAETDGNEFAVDEISLTLATAATPPACANNLSPVNNSSIGSTSTTLSWSNVANASSYDVYLWSGATPPATPTATVTTNSYTTGTLSAATNYKWFIAAKNASGTASNCAAANTSNFTTAALPVPACVVNNSPVNGSTVPGLSSAVLSWSATATATSYDVFIWSGNIPAASPVASTASTSYTAANLQPGNLYNWYVSPKNAIGTAIGCGATNSSSFYTTAIAGAVPACVTNSSPAKGSSIATTGTVTLRWSASVNATSYDVYLFTGTTLPASPVANVTGTSYDATSMLTGKEYKWYIVPRNANGAAVNCGASNASSFTTVSLDIPACVANVSPTQGSMVVSRTSAQLQWTLSPVATSYDVYIWSGNTAPLQPTANVAGVSYTAFGLLPASAYHWFVAPRNDNGVAAGCAVSSVTSFTTGGLVSVPPSCAVNASPADGSTIASQTTVTLTWMPARNASAYDVYVWQTAGLPLTPVARVTALTYTVNGLSPATTYKWFVAPANMLAGAIVCAAQQSSFTTATATVATGGGQGLRGDYFNNPNMGGKITMSRTDVSINFNWGNSSPAARIDKKTFSVRWTGQVLAPYSQLYTFYTFCDNGARLWVNGKLITDSWKDRDVKEESGSIWLTAGVKYNIRLEYYEKKGNAVAKLYWSGASTPKVIVPQQYLYLPPIIYFKPEKTKDGRRETESFIDDDKKEPRINIIFPNPVRSGNNASLGFINGKSGPVQVLIMDARGNILRSQQVMLASGNSNVIIRTAGLMPGVYLVNILGTAATNSTLKLIIY